jgi:tetraacyldisaccharide 4'-kinase
MKLSEHLRALLAGTQRGPAATLKRVALRVASVPYGWAVRARNGLFDRGWKHSEKAGVPVISVGNLTVGGTGKTPCVEYVARRLREWDRQVAILSRGYGNDRGPNDEALVLEENLPDVPHLQDADRVALAKIAVTELESDALVLDDGFQHRRLARDLDIVLIDATEPWGYGYLLPRGLLREPASGLKRAGVIVLTRCDQVDAASLTRLREQTAKLAPLAPIVETSHRPAHWIDAQRQTRPLEYLRGKKALAFCGIGNPDAFRKTLEGLGVTIEGEGFRAFPDHHPYGRTDVEALRNWARQEATEGVVVTTQKDLVKLRLTRLGDCELWALRIQLHPHAGQDALDRKLKEALG